MSNKKTLKLLITIIPDLSMSASESQHPTSGDHPEMETIPRSQPDKENTVDKVYTTTSQRSGTTPKTGKDMSRRDWERRSAHSFRDVPRMYM